MKLKLFELRDRMTFIPVFAFKPDNVEYEREHYLSWRAGYHNSDAVIFGNLEYPERCKNDPYDWNDRTYATAHMYIQNHFDELDNGQVIDVEFILGETSAPKVSEAFER